MNDDAKVQRLPRPDGNTIAVCDPVYPIYVDTNVMAGHTGEADAKGEYQGLVYMRATAENNFSPDIPKQKVDLIYLCFPNNPTGAVYPREIVAALVQLAEECPEAVQLIRARTFARAVH